VTPAASLSRTREWTHGLSETRMPTHERSGAVGDELIQRALEKPRAGLAALIGVDLDKGVAE